jgi:hypothetical protein
MNHHDVCALLLAVLLGGCTERDPAGLTPKPVGPEPTPAEPGPFSWRRAGGETTDFGGNDEPTCDLSSTPITRQQASERGFDVSATLAQIEGVHEADLVWSKDHCYEQGTCPHTRLTIATRLESIALISLTPRPDFEDAWGDCHDRLEYTLNVELSTADGSLAGSFQSRVSSLKNVDGSLSGSGTSIALRDLRGSQRLSVDMARPHWTMVEFGEHWGTQFGGGLEVTVLYTDGKDPVEQRALGAAWSSVEPAVLSNGDPLATGPDSIALDEYQGSTIPPTFEVEARPRFDQPGSRLRVTINGAATDFDTIPEGQVLTLGKRQIGDVVSAEVIDNQGSYVESVLRVGECTWVSQSCSTPGCTARAEATVAPKRCYSGYYD